MRKATQQEIKDAGDMKNAHATNHFIYGVDEVDQLTKLLGNKKARRYMCVRDVEGKDHNLLYEVEKTDKDGYCTLTRRVKKIPKSKKSSKKSKTCDIDVADLKKLTKADLLKLIADLS